MSGSPRSTIAPVPVNPPSIRRPTAGLAGRVVQAALGRGVLLLGEGPHANVRAITPPLVIAEAQLDHALDVVEDEFARVPLP